MLLPELLCVRELLLETSLLKMRGSYLMVDPARRLFDKNERGPHTYSGAILKVKLKDAFAQITLIRLYLNKGKGRMIGQ